MPVQVRAARRLEGLQMELERVCGGVMEAKGQKAVQNNLVSRRPDEEEDDDDRVMMMRGR
jgi:hypothetical protein